MAGLSQLVGSARRRSPILVFLLTCSWLVLWRDISVANVISGLIVASLAVLVLGGDRTIGAIRPRPLMQLLWAIAVDLVRSTIAVAHEVLTPTDYTKEAVIAVQIDRAARPHLLLFVVAITLTPGTAVADVDPEKGRLYLHLLHVDRAEAVVAHTNRIASLATLAFPRPLPPTIGDSS